MNFKALAVPNGRPTSYICRGFRFPTDKEYHITKFAPVQSNLDVLHHMVLYKSQEYFGDEYRDCASMPENSEPIFAWAAGMGDFELPPDVGIRVGRGVAEYGVLQVHYDNPSKLGGLEDSSGIRMEMTRYGIT